MGASACGGDMQQTGACPSPAVRMNANGVLPTASCKKCSCLPSYRLFGNILADELVVGILITLVPSTSSGPHLVLLGGAAEQSQWLGGSKNRQARISPAADTWARHSAHSMHSTLSALLNDGFGRAFGPPNRACPQKAGDQAPREAAGQAGPMGRAPLHAPPAGAASGPPLPPPCSPFPSPPHAASSPGKPASRPSCLCSARWRRRPPPPLSLPPRRSRWPPPPGSTGRPDPCWSLPAAPCSRAQGSIFLIFPNDYTGKRTAWLVIDGAPRQPASQPAGARKWMDSSCPNCCLPTE